MEQKEKIKDMLKPRSAEQIPEEDTKEGGKEAIIYPERYMSDIFPTKETELDDTEEDSGDEDDIFADDDEDDIFADDDKTEEDEYGYMDDSFDDDDDDTEEQRYGFGTCPLPQLPYPQCLMNQNIVNQYVEVEFEVKDEFKPAFKTILSIMRMFKDAFIPYKIRVFMIDSLVKNINLQSKKINWTGWRESVTDYIFDEPGDIKAYQFSLDDLKKSNVPLHSIETKTIPCSYFERERLNREFLDCFQEDEGRDHRNIVVPSWKKLTKGDLHNFMKVVNIRKDPAEPDGTERVYCRIQFYIDHCVDPVNKRVGQFIGTFGPYTSEFENPLIPALKANFKIENKNFDEQVELVITRDNESTCKKIYINGFENVKDNLNIFRRDLKKLPDEIVISLQDINYFSDVLMTIKLKPELFESAEILERYLEFKEKTSYISTREKLEEILNLLDTEANMTRQYVNHELGTSNYEYMYDEETNMREFLDNLPPHLKKRVECSTSGLRAGESEEELGLVDNLHDMLGFITDISKFQFHFIPKPFETDDENEPEIMEQVNIELEFSLVGVSAEDLHLYTKKIEDNAEVGFVYERI
ncbi:MAG: hypothetical protein IKY94_05455 [Lachnospiraceae bacterium]|nr:hypothetical protein [Lachnospiraceae bacterium]